MLSSIHYKLAVWEEKSVMIAFFILITTKFVLNVKDKNKAFIEANTESASFMRGEKEPGR